METDAEVLVVGAGVAGMAAALDIVRQGVKVAIVEARDRVGGRVFSKPDAAANAPIELGAEFVHGRPPEILDLLRELKIEPVPTSGEDWCEENGQLKPCDLFSDIDQLLEQMDDMGPDEAFQDFLERSCPSTDEQTKYRAIRYIMGFHAADPALISVHSLVRGLRADEKIDGERAFRIPGGYAVLIDYFRKHLNAARVPICLNTVVQHVRWSSDRVSLQCHTDAGHRTYSASKVLVTLPLGVLQARAGDAGAVHFSPDLPPSKRSALNYLAMGKVMRITLRFRERFWENSRPSGSKTLADMRFLFSQQNWFPTWWTTMPLKAPLLIGWAPFDWAEKLAGADPTLVFSSASDTLRALFKMHQQDIEDLTEAAVFHDWQTDPFSYGAYSYVKAGGDSAQADLAAPVDRTLFFAGEATDLSGYHGTVHGAIASAHRAAQEILRSRNAK
ncbi:MAG TPA: NAD(P)/FAD-dependent oxidoreductase [Terriglobales bacterium]